MLVSVWVHSEDVPEHVVKFFLRGFLQDFNDEGLDFSFVQISLRSLVVLIKVFFKFSPNQLDKSEFFSTNTRYRGRLWLILDFFRRFVNNGQTSAQILSDEVNVLLESNPVVSVGVDDLEDFSQKVVFGSESEEESVFSDEVDEVLKTESQTGGVVLVLSLDDNFDKEDFKDDGDEFFKSGELILSGFEFEIVVNNVADFLFIKLEHTLQNDFNFVNFKHQVLI